MSMADRIAVMHDGQVQQVDTPVDLYQRPANTFVADFIGSSNSFAGTCVPDGVDVAGLGMLRGRTDDVASGVPAVLVIRPEDISLVAPGEGMLAGTVLDTQFYGGRSTIAVQVIGHERPVTVTCQGTASVRRGADVHLAWQADRGIVLSAQG
jgi:spermidine/putrescine transport system ATP-binding protein/putrescine transport system ATP-binding protein